MKKSSMPLVAKTQPILASINQLFKYYHQLVRFYIPIYKLVNISTILNVLLVLIFDIGIIKIAQTKNATLRTNFSCIFHQCSRDFTSMSLTIML